MPTIDVLSVIIGALGVLGVECVLIAWALCRAAAMDEYAEFRTIKHF